MNKRYYIVQDKNIIWTNLTKSELKIIKNTIVKGYEYKEKIIKKGFLGFGARYEILIKDYL